MPGRNPQTGVQVTGLFLRNNARTLSGLLLITLLLVLMRLGMQWFADPHRFPLNVVEVKGDFRYLDREQLEKSIAAHTEGGFFTVDVAAICAAAEQLPWVYQAKVQRIWPDSLRLQIEEQQPIARWGKQGFLNRFGESFISDEPAAADELPALAGPAGQESRVLEQFQLVSGLLAPLGMKISRLELDGRRAWHLQTERGVQLELGRVNVWQRLQRLVQAYPAVFEGRLDELQHIDLRYSNGFSVYWRQAAPADAGAERA
ncbi:MAG: cell division protein FtsQ/DivIB [Gammaproteobacteria bacterium]